MAVSVRREADSPSVKIATSCLDCGGIASRRGRCDSCNAKREQERGSSTQRGYGAEWRKLRRILLNKQPTCQVPTGEKGVFDNGVPWQVVCGRRTEEIDHITSKAQGGTDDRSNLRAVCRFHNRSKGSKVA